MTKRESAKAKEPMNVPFCNPEDEKPRLKRVGGSQSDKWNNVIANQAVQALWVKNSTPQETDKLLSATIAALAGIAPKDELEGMMAAQLVAAHNASMECFRRAMLPDQTFDGRRENLNQANKLSRTWATLVDALNKHRGKGQQKVTVEHVHVHAGGQAVVGTIERPGGGGDSKTEEQTHAKQIGHASQPALWSEDPERETMPITRDAKRSV